MKALTIAAMAASALMTLAGPSLGTAQSYGQQGYGQPGYGQQGGDHHDWDHRDNGMAAPGGWDLDRRIDWLQQRINRGRADGSLDRGEAWRAQRALGDIRQDERRMRYRNGGRLDDRQRGMLQVRLDRLNDQLHWMRRNDDRRPW